MSEVTKGSILLDFHIQNLFISRDVIFVEHIFPLKMLLALSSSKDSHASDSLIFYYLSSSVSFPFDPDLDHTVPLSPLVDATPFTC